MRLQWDNKYEYEAGDVVEVIGKNHPLKGQRGIINVCFSEKQFGVYFGHTTPDFRKEVVSLWTANLKLIETHRYDK
jgi:hypothetical protein